MPHSITDGQSFPMLCPQCNEVEAMPLMVGTHLESGGIKVAMRCRKCSHEWAVRHARNFRTEARWGHPSGRQTDLASVGWVGSGRIVQVSLCRCSEPPDA
jgi:hypothetical protein